MPREIVPIGGGLYKMTRAEKLEEQAKVLQLMKVAQAQPLDVRGDKKLFKNIETQDQLEKLDQSQKFGDAKIGDPIYDRPLEKSSLTTAGGLVTYDLRAPSLHLIPWLSPLRDMIPRKDKSAKAGVTAHWKSIFASSIVQTAYQASPYIIEGARAPLFTFSAQEKSANYVSIGRDGSVTYEAVSASAGLEDALATARFFCLESLMVSEEDVLLGGNLSTKLGTVGTVTTGTLTLGGTLTAITWDVYCVALSYEGYRNSTVAGGVATQKQITTPDAKVMTVNGGSSNISALATQATSGTQSLTASVAAINGAFAYAWYIGPSGAARLAQITTINSVVQTVTPSTSTQLFSSITADLSVNDGVTGAGTNQVTAYDGMLYQCIAAAGAFTAATGTYVNANSYAINLLGNTLTASGAGGISEIDTMMAYQWNTFRVSLSQILVNAQELKNITAKILTNASAPLLRYNLNADGEHYDMVASGTISFYFNPYMPGGGRKIPIVVHPTLPAGTILFQGKQIPPYFKKSSMANVSEVICRRDYYSVDWADITREYQFGTYSEEVLALYFPPAFAILTGIASG